MRAPYFISGEIMANPSDLNPGTAKNERLGSATYDAYSPPSAENNPKSSIDARAFIDVRAVIEGGCTIKSGVHICGEVAIKQGTYVGPNVAFVEKLDGTSSAGTVVGKQVRIGANSTIGAGVVIGDKAIVRPGSVVTRSVPPGAIVEGNPASIIGYVDACNDLIDTFKPSDNQNPRSVRSTPVKGVSVHYFPLVPDMRGTLTVGEFERQIPFTPKRYFMVFDVPSREVRGEHAHHTCHQFLICVRGSCSVVADDGTHKTEVLLDTPYCGLNLPPMTWGIQYRYSPDAMLLVFASSYYDPEDYIRDYSDFLRLAGKMTKLNAAQHDD